MDWATRIAELMWGAGLAAVPVAIVAAVCCRIKSFRPATRHAMWFAVLFTLLSPVLMAGVWRPSWFRSDRVLSVVDSLTPPATTEISTAPQTEGIGEVTVESLEAPIALNPSLLSPAFERLSLNAAPSDSQRTAPEAGIGAIPAALGLVPSDVRPVVSRPAFDGIEGALLTPTAKRDLTIVAEKSTRAAAPVPLIKAANPTREWLTQVLAVRDALAAMPSIPPLVWVIGAGLLLSMWTVRYVMVRRLIRRADAAPAPLAALVRRLAAVAGVKRVPETLVVDDRVSPMIWCGFRPRLIIPRALWRELDTKCQCAVIVHELCHLRRRDHRLCWVESLIGLAYWWHPVSWWARRRLRDEAESCCDAWVTTLLPGGRRAYAEALVATKSFLSVPGRSGAPGLGVSGRTRQLARRVTMVMTQRVAPRASVFGLAFAIAIAATGMFVMPGLACPPEEAKAKEEAKAAAAAMKVKNKAKAEKDAKGALVEFYGEAPALEAMRATKQAKERGNSDVLQDKVRMLRDKERALQDMEKRLQEMEVRLQQLQQQGQRGPRGAIAVPAQPNAIAALSGQLSTPRAIQPGIGATAITLPRGGALTTTISPRGRVATPRAEAITINGETVARSYALPAGKLDAFTSLMIRDDVPILVSRDGNKITINATERQHEVFGAFIKMINPDGHSASSGVDERAVTVHAQAARQYAEELKAAARALEAQKRDSQRQYQQLNRQLERTKEQTLKLREQHEAARQKAEEDGVEESNDPVIIELDGLDGRLEQLDGLSERIDEQLEALQCTIECLKEQAQEQSELPEGVIAPEQPAEPEAALTTPMPAPYVSPTPAARAMPARSMYAPGMPARAAVPAVPGVPPAPPAPDQPAAATAPVAPVAPATPAAVPSAPPAPPTPVAAAR